MELLTYRFSKERNSTKQPETALHTYDVKLKNDTTITSPTFLINGVDLTVNYCKWNGRYYFINDIVLNNNNIYELNCSIDTLATWKSEILSSKQYVLRSASQYDGTIVDSYYPAKNDYIYDSETLNAVPRTSKTIILGVSGAPQHGGTSIGSVTYYAVNSAGMLNLMHTLMNDTSYMAIPQDIMDINLQKAQINPIQYITSAKVIPVSYDSITAIGSTDTIHVGWWSIGVGSGNCKQIANIKDNSERTVTTFTLKLNNHPQADEYNADYYNYGSWTERTLYYEPYGTIPLDNSLLDNSSTIICNEIVDLVSGLGTLRVYSNNSNGYGLIAYSTAQLGADIQLSQVAVDHYQQQKIAINAQAGALTSMIGGMSSGNMAGMLSGIINAGAIAETGIIDSRLASFPQFEKSGMSNSMAAFNYKPYLYSKFTISVDTDEDRLGRPLCKSVILNTLSGFCLVQDSELQLPCLGDEVETIKALMNSGFYIE